jgi:hypothetical protein
MKPTEFRPPWRALARTLPVLLALAALGLSGRAQAQLQIVEFEVLAEATALRNGRMESSVLSDTSPLGLPWVLTTQLDATVGDSASTQRYAGTASATQTKTGWFRADSVAQHDWFTDPVEVASWTRFYALVETTQANTPLVLHFNFMGSSLRSDARYSARGAQLEVEAMISASLNPPAGSIPGASAAVWAFQDSIGFSSGYQLWHQEIDMQGIGMPALHTDTRWVDMRNLGEMRRDAFTGTLDFGLLQPGERFAFSYLARTHVRLDTTYAAVGTATVIDPFSLGGTPPPQFTMDGLILPAAPVPEPPAALLGLAGLAVLAAVRRTRRTPCDAFTVVRANDGSSVLRVVHSSAP